jgi:tetratricopeptide (TPR) repeat protein
MSLEHLGDLKGALKAYKVAIHVDPRYPDTYRSRGWTYSSIRNRTRAIQDFTKFIRLRPNDADGRAEYAMQIILVGRKQEALQQLNVAVKLDKNCVSAYIPRGSIRSEIGDMKGAISDLNKAIELRPDFSLGYYHRALALLKLGEKKSAQRDLKKALHLAPKDERVSQKLKDL